MVADLFPESIVATRFSREWAMPNHETFSIPPIGSFVMRYLRGVSVDPFARNKRLATHTNDLSPETTAAFHMDAELFCQMLAGQGVVCDVALFDPPYSPRQISAVYKSVGLTVGMKETQSALLYKRVRDALDKIMRPGGVVLSFGWSTNGMGIGRGYTLDEVLLVAHGGAHNDTICIAERKSGVSP